jgi:hypothetical protein
MANSFLTPGVLSKMILDQLRSNLVFREFANDIVVPKPKKQRVARLNLSPLEREELRALHKQRKILVKKLQAAGVKTTRHPVVEVSGSGYTRVAVPNNSGSFPAPAPLYPQPPAIDWGHTVPLNWRTITLTLPPDLA